MGRSQSASSSNVSTTTNTVTDSYNQAYNRVSNLSGVGNVSLGDAGGLNTGMVLVLVGGLVFAVFILKKGKR